jgi:integrase
LENKTVDIWFDKAPLGKNTLGDKMKNLSKQLNLSKLYTNHSLRATTITLLDNKCFEARHIMYISGHKIESSIRNYSRTDDTQKRKIAKALSDTIIGMQ